MASSTASGPGASPCLDREKAMLVRADGAAYNGKFSMTGCPSPWLLV